VTPIVIDAGRYDGSVIDVRDVTVLRKLEAVRRDFVANVSHEMKTPLTSIQGYVETLQDGAVDDPETARAFLGKIERNAKSLAHLVTDLLVLSRVESGGLRIDDDPIVVASVIGESAAAVADKAREKGVVIHVAGADRDLRVRGDRDLLVRAVVNLLDNAVQYTAPGGRVDAHCVREGANVEIRVTDTGIGIPAADIERIFERFYRVDKARSRSLGGTGLGLAIVKHVAEQHGGTIRVASVEGRGSTFSLSIPLGG
jgi:signal transduction histidine kinase